MLSGEQLTVLCAAPGGSPPAQLSWTVAGRAVHGLSTGPGRSRLRLELSAADNGARVTCISNSPALEGEQRDSVTVTVHCEWHCTPSPHTVSGIVHRHRTL